MNSHIKKIVAITLIITLFIGCLGTSINGYYADGSDYIIVNDKSISINVKINGDFVSNYGKILSVSKSDDGNSSIVSGEVDYSGGSGTAFGVTVKPGQERHWTRPFTATIDQKEGVLSFNGTVIIDSLTMRSWSANFKKRSQ